MCECLDFSDGSREMCPVCVDLHDTLVERERHLQSLVTLQADDVKLWFVKRPPKEADVAHLQESLRELHLLIVGKKPPRKPF